MKLLRYTLYVFAGLLLLASAAFGFLYFHTPNTAPARTITVRMERDRIERGRYLFRLGDCDGCHSERDFSRFGGPVVETGRGRGNVLPFNDLPGRIVAANITPDVETGIGSWTDGEKIRAIREGVDRDGHALFPMMPYGFYRYMSDDDVECLVAYLNSLKPVKNALPRTEVRFPVSMLMKFAPEPAGPVKAPDRRNPRVYGEYLVTVAGCMDCHTPFEKGKLDLTMKFAGGRAFEASGLKVVSANITPHAETGIGKWDFARFQQRFRAYQPYVHEGSPKVGPEKFTVMPWLNLSQLPDEDLAAIFEYLNSQTPVDHLVEKAKFQRASLE